MGYKKKKHLNNRSYKHSTSYSSVFFKFDNALRSSLLITGTFFLVLILSIYSAPKFVALKVDTYAKTVLVTPIPMVLPIVPLETSYRVSQLKQSYETTEKVKQKICEVFKDKCREALVVALHESGYYLKARSYADARGIMQIHCPAHKNKVQGDCDKLYDLDINLIIAKAIYERQGWGPWSARIWLAR